MDFGHFLGKICSDHFLDHFLDPATKPRSQGFDPDLFMAELPCHQLGAKIKRVILTFRPGSTYQHQNNICSCRCGERDLFLSPVPPVLPLIFSQKKIMEKQDPWKGSFLVHVWSFLSKCPNVDFLGAEGGATATRRDDDDKPEITWPLPHHTQGPNTSWGTPSLW